MHVKSECQSEILLNRLYRDPAAHPRLLQVHEYVPLKQYLTQTIFLFVISVFYHCYAYTFFQEHKKNIYI